MIPLSDIVTGLEAGADDYVKKPARAAELLARLKTATRIVQLERSLRASNEQVRLLSITDALVGTYNRRYLNDELVREVERSRRYGRPLSAVLTDLDQFNRINDEHGHQTGDEVLRHFADLVRLSIRQSDWIARYGGEEFVIVLPDTNLSGAAETAEKIRAACAAAPFVTSTGHIAVTASFGVARLLARHAGTDPQVVIVAFGIERLALINDSLGRHTGDLVVQCVADGLKRQFGDTENLAHLEGGAFAAMITGQQSYEGAVRLLHDHIIAMCGRPLDVAGREIPVTVKAGLAGFPENGADAESLLQNAEAALHQARKSGDRYLRYRRDMSSEVLERLALEQRLRAALKANQFVLHYQPTVELVSGAIVGAEALLRWRDPVCGLVAPDGFLSVLESAGLILEVGKWALHQATADLRRWQQLGNRPMRVAVNVSPVQLRQQDFAARFLGIADARAQGLDGLDVEITEGVLLEDPVFLAGTLQTLRDAGVRVAIDDFGTGYSSLSRLSQLPVDTLKIDRSFITRLVEDPTAQAVVSTIVSLARAFELGTVAEGVETVEQLKLLQSLGCEQSQGYLHSRPVPAEQFEVLLSTYQNNQVVGALSPRSVAQMG